MTVSITTRSHRSRVLIEALRRAGSFGLATPELARLIYGVPDRTLDVLALISKLRSRHHAPIENLTAWPPGRSNHGRYRLTDKVRLVRPKRIEPSPPGRAPCRCDEMREGRRCPACSMREAWSSGRHRRRRPSIRPDVWTAEEDRFLARLAGKTETEMADAFAARFRIQRTGRAIRMRMITLGMQTAQEGFTCQALSRLFGISSERIQLAWIRKSLLIGTRGEPSRQATHRNRPGWWRVPEAEVERFIRAYPWEYDHKAMDPSHPLTLVAREVARQRAFLSPQEAARVLGIKPTALTKMIRDGILPARRRTSAHRRNTEAVGRDLRIEASDLLTIRHLAPSTREHLEKARKMA